MLGSDEQWPGRNVLNAAVLELDVADHAQQPEISPAPEGRNLEDGATGQYQRRDRGNQMQEQVQIEQDIEDNRADDDGHQRSPPSFRNSEEGNGQTTYELPLARVSPPSLEAKLRRMRRLAKTYFTYSNRSSRAVAVLPHHDSVRSLSVTTGKGTSATSGSWCPISISARGM